MKIITYESQIHFQKVLELHILFLNELAKLRKDISKKVLLKNKEEEYLKEFLQTQNTDCFIIVEGEEVIGYSISYLCKTIDPLHFVERKFAFIDEIFIHSSCRRQGYATELIQHLKKHYKRNGIECMELYLLSNNFSAYKVYLNNNFSVQSMRMEIKL